MITDRMLADISTEILDSKEAWLDYWTKQIVPPVVYRWTKERRHMSFLVHYFERQRIRIVSVQGDTAEHLYHGDRLIASFKVEFRK